MGLRALLLLQAQTTARTEAAATTMCWPPPWHTWMLLCKEDLEGLLQAAMVSASGMLAAGLAQGLVLCRVGGGSKFCST